jgi:hypothetical protein
VIVADQLVAHAVGDYVVQSDWMANEKTSRTWPALAHAVSYALPFLFLTRSVAALAVIAGTHFVIDRWRLARFVVWAKEHLAPSNAWPPWPPTTTGYPEEKPPWLAVWLMIIADNVMHVLINGAALRWLT